jgi:hypothetical protein
MRKALFLLLCLTSAARAADAPVVLVTVNCQDYFVVSLGARRYALLEWYGGYRPEKGDVVSGDFSHFGAQDVTVKGQRLRIYVEDYDLDQDAINDKLSSKCK